MHQYRTPKKSWINIDSDSDFSLANLPYGVFKTSRSNPRVGVAIGAQILDLAALFDLGFFADLGLNNNPFATDSLNEFMALGRPIWTQTRQRILDLLDDQNAELSSKTALHAEVLILQTDAQMLMPVQVPNYTDFYSSQEHATNVGKMFRPDGEPLLPNWKHIPVGYHGRASSILVSGTPIRRPWGQLLPPDANQPVFAPCRLLDFELEMAFVVGKPNALGDPISIDKAEDHMFGMVIFNDWSARDIQKWEYVPLGPFLAKNFASSISPWVVTLDALQPFRCPAPQQDVEPLSYLKESDRHSFDIQLSVSILPENSEEGQVCQSNFKYLYWTMAQQLAHHTVNGCNTQVGDMYASGTISGKEQNSFGSMLELSWKGSRKVALPGGLERTFIQDGDTVIMRAFAQKEGLRVGFGEVRSKVLPAHPEKA